MIISIRLVHKIRLVQPDKLGNDVKAWSSDKSQGYGRNYKVITVDSSVLDQSTIDNFDQLHMEMHNVFKPSKLGYNGNFGHIKAVINRGPVQPPQERVNSPVFKG